MVEILMYKGDLRPSLQPTLKYADGSVVDLTGASVKFELVEMETNVTILNETATIVGDPTNGEVKYTWKANETNVSRDKYRGRFTVTFSDSKQQTFPRRDDLYISFKEKEGVY